MQNLPSEIQEIIYKKMGPKERVKMKLALPKKSLKLCNPKISKKLYVVNNFITKYKAKLKDKTKLIPEQIFNFLCENKDDEYIRNLAKEIDIDIVDIEENKGFNVFLADIKKNQIKDIFNYDIHSGMEVFKLITKYLYMYSNVETFEQIYKHPEISKLFEFEENITDFCFGLISYENEELLDHVMTSGKYEWINTGKLYISSPNICSIFAYDIPKIQAILKYTYLSRESKLKILEVAEENIYEDTVLFIQKII